MRAERDKSRLSLTDCSADVVRSTLAAVETCKNQQHVKCGHSLSVPRRIESKTEEKKILMEVRGRLFPIREESTDAHFVFADDNENCVTIQMHFALHMLQHHFDDDIARSFGVQTHILSIFFLLQSRTLCLLT